MFLQSSNHQDIITIVLSNILYHSALNQNKEKYSDETTLMHHNQQC